MFFLFTQTSTFYDNKNKRSSIVKAIKIFFMEQIMNIHHQRQQTYE